MDPIKYDGFQYRYVNTGRIQSHGAEGELALRYGNWGGYGNISLAMPGSQSSDNLLTTDKKQFLGMPTWKLSAGVYYNIKKLQFSPSLTYLTKRQAQSQASGRDSVLIMANTTYPDVLLLNFSITYKNIIKNLDLRLTGTNLLGSKYVLIQPYYGDHAPLPVYDRHISLTAIVRF
jgi:outer membrane receptor protein involved in Fe transport